MLNYQRVRIPVAENWINGALFVELVSRCFEKDFLEDHGSVAWEWVKVDFRQHFFSVGVLF